MLASIYDITLIFLIGFIGWYLIHTVPSDLDTRVVRLKTPSAEDSMETLKLLRRKSATDEKMKDRIELLNEAVDKATQEQTESLDRIDQLSLKLGSDSSSMSAKSRRIDESSDRIEQMGQSIEALNQMMTQLSVSLRQAEERAQHLSAEIANEAQASNNIAQRARDSIKEVQAWMSA